MRLRGYIVSLDCFLSRVAISQRCFGVAIKPRAIVSKPLVILEKEEPKESYRREQNVVKQEKVSSIPSLVRKAGAEDGDSLAALVKSTRSTYRQCIGAGVDYTQIARLLYFH